MEPEKIPEEEMLLPDTPEEEKPAKKKRSPVYSILLGFFILVFLFSAVMVVRYIVGSRRAAQEYDELAGILESVQNEQKEENDDSSENASPDGPSQEQGNSGILPEYAPFYEMNSDMIGWISIPNTVINYPVMQTPEQPNYYLKRNFYKKGSDWGAIYAREECDVFAPSDNVVLYGHRMNDGSMFASLYNFASKAYWQENQTFTFDTLYEHHTYRVWAVFKTSAIVGKGFSYHTFNDAQNMEEFDQFVEDVREIAFYDTGIVPTYGDKLLTLSTCEYTLNQGRFVVCAVRVDAPWEME